MKNLHHFFLMNAFAAAFLLFSTAGQATTCSNAIPITSFPVVGQPLVCGSSNDLNSISVPGICGTGFNLYKEGKEALYTFTPSVTSTYIIQYFRGIFESAIWVYSGCPASGGMCVGAVGSSEGYKELRVTLTAGVTYFIWFDVTPSLTSDSPCDFYGAFSITTPITNDECSSAISFPAIPTDANCSSVIAVTATATGTTNLICNGNQPLHDVWYRFTTPPGITSLHYTISTISGISDRVFQIFSGSSCADMTMLNCYDPETGFITGLSGNTTYFMRVFTKTNLLIQGGAFEICLRRPRINDNCPNAIAFPAIPADGSCATVTDGTTASTDSGLTACQGTADDDVWYSFIAPAGVSALWYSFTPISGATDMTMQVYSGSCSQLLPAGCYGNESGAISNLTPGLTYYLRVYTYYSNVASEYNLCLRAPVANDNCSGAFSFPAIPGDGACATATINTTDATGPEGWVCEGYPDDDVWMRFLTPAGVAALSYEITTVSGNPGISFQLYPSSCGTTPIGCFSSPSGIITGLAGSSVYYVRLYTRTSNARAVFNLCLRAIVPPPNDQCAGAIALPSIPIDGTCMMAYVSTYGATGMQSTTCVGSEDDDVWYSFTLPPGYTSVHYNLVRLSGSYDGVIQLMRGSCSGTLTSVGCYDPEVGTMTGLNSNTTYYLRIFSYESGMFSAFNLCLRVTPPAINDECTSAIAFPNIPGDGSCATVTSTTDGAVDKDVWFVFEAPADGAEMYYEISPVIQSVAHRLNLYRGDCDNLSFTGRNYSSIAGKLEQLEAGETYYVRVFATSSTSPFSFCLRRLLSPANDECEGAIAFPPIAPEGGCSIVRASTYEASGIPDDICAGAEDDDLWYTFTTSPNTTHLIIKLEIAEWNDDIRIQILRGTCFALESIGCYQFESFSSRKILTGLEGNTTYYLRAYTNQSGETRAAFDICLINPVANDFCTQAINFPDFQTDGSCSGITVSTYNSSGTATPQCSGTEDDDVWYRFTTPVGVSALRYKITDNADSQFCFEILTGTCDNLTSIGCYNGTTGITEGVINGLSGSTTYYLKAYTFYGGAQTTFKICLAPPPPNDDCSGAIAFPPIPSDGACSSVQTGNFGAGGTADPTCPGNETDDVWLSFTLPAGADKVYYELGSMMQFQLLKGNCSSLIPIACFNSLNGFIRGLNDNETYYMRLYGSRKSIDVCLRVPVAHDECAGAIAFPLIPTDGSCARVNVSSTELASMTPGISWCGNNDKDVWFSFVAPDSDAGRLQATLEHFSENTLSGIELYSGQCGNLVSIECNNTTYGWVFPPLTAGETYYLRVAVRWHANLNLCLKTPAINDLCANAIAFPSIPTDGSCATVSGATFGATGAYDPTCYGDEDDDVWLTFTTPTGVNTLLYELFPPENNQIRFQLFAGNCASPISFGCFSETRGEISGLTESAIYYMRVYTYGSIGGQSFANFNICLRVRPSNNLCSGALPFPEITTDGNCASLRVTTLGGTVTPGMTCGTDRPDIWYTFTTPPDVTRLRYFKTDLDNTLGVDFQVFREDCNTLQLVGCYGADFGTISNLNSNTTYYLRIYSSSAVTIGIANLCLMVMPYNDECSQAINFPSWQPDTDSIFIVADNRGATISSAPTCTVSNYGDIWFRFIVPPNVSRLGCRIDNSSFLVSGVQILNGDCATLSSVGCYSGSQIIIANLQGGNIYYMRVLGSWPLETGGGRFNISLHLPPPNDDCTDASVISFSANGSCTNVHVNTLGARETTIAGCAGNKDDVWYAFTCPPGMTTLHYSITNVSGSSTPILQLFRGSCSNLTAIGCYTSLNGTINGLAENTTYYLRAYKYDYSPGLQYDICFRRTPVPPNDHCQDAIALPEIAPNGGCTTMSGTVQGASNDHISSCNSVGNHDVWFTFRTPSNVSHILYKGVLASGGNVCGFEILSGSCGSFSSLGCYQPSGGVITGLQSNTIYHIRVFKAFDASHSDFAFCLQLPIVNDICATATLIDGCNASVTANLASATDIGGGPHCVNEVFPRGVWYRWVGDGLPVVVHTCPAGPSSGAFVEVYKGNCDSLICVTGNRNGGCVYGALTSWHSSAGENYYIYVYGYQSSVFTLTLAGGSQCSAPAAASLVSLTDSTATIAWPAVAGAAYYKYAVSQGTTCHDDAPVLSSSENTVSLSGLLPLTEYTFCLRAHCSCTSTGSTTVRFTTPARPLPNDFCATALAASCGSTITGNTEGAFPDISQGICEGSNLLPGHGVWYQIQGDGSIMTLDLCASSFDTKVHVYEGACGSLRCVASNDDACGAQSSLSFPSLPNQNYYILVSGADDAFGEFTMDINCVCQLPLESPWTTASIGAGQGSAVENLCNGSIDLNYEGNAPVNQADRQIFTSQNACDTFSLITRVHFIHPEAFAGIAIRENDAPGARMIALKSKGTKYVYLDTRTATDGARNTQQAITQNHRWLRLTRAGDVFTAYTSADGLVWQQHFVVNMSMPDCLQAGLFVENAQNGANSTGVFTGTSIVPAAGGTSLPGGDIPTGDFPMEFTVSPNPALTELRVAMSSVFSGKGLSISIVNQLGQTMTTRKIEMVENLIETFDVQAFPPGVYVVCLRSEGSPLVVKKCVVGGRKY
ncbi:MAG TPA: hypothetical protein PLZ12_11210 [Saprospiraceae bacterium]|nr:hypothetical protein [Saprospiraceae bacterium]